MGLDILACIALFAITPGQARSERDCESSFPAVDALLKKAAVETKQKDLVSANSDYDAAMHQLSAIPWSPPDEKCDPDRFRFQKFVTTVQSMTVGMDLGRLKASEAQTIEANILTQIYSLVKPAPELSAGNHADISVTPAQGGAHVGVTVGGGPAGANEYYYMHYRPLYDRYFDYAKEIADRWTADEVSLHNPTSDSCAVPNLEPEPFVPAVIVRSGIVDGTYTASAAVQLSADGTVLGAALKDSSGNRYFDDTVLKEAEQTKYLPAIANCKRVPSVYVFTSNAHITH